MVHAQKPEFVFRRNGRAHLNRRGRQFNRLLAAEVCAPAVVMLDTPCSEVVWRVLTTHSIRQFPLHFPSRASPCAIRFQLDSNVDRLLPHSCPAVLMTVVTWISSYLLGAFAKLRKAFISFVMSVCSSAWINSTDFPEIWYFRASWKSVKKIQV
jgi:hypothetical protein